MKNLKMLNKKNNITIIILSIYKKLLLMNKSQRIKIDVNDSNIDKYLKVKLEQDISTLEFLSLKLDTKDVYNNFNADYGVLIGRVIANGGVGIPNAKISIFIPVDDDDLNDGVIKNIYPYKTPRDKNDGGKRYNLLPRVGKINQETKEISPKQPFGTFPIKEEILMNDNYLKIYKKYYKYTTSTNDSGDYMLFGVPIGTETVHLSVDITDIGEYSVTPAAMVTNLGYSSNLFTDNNSKIKESDDLDDLPHIETQEISVDILPFWGDEDNFEIGFTRQDFRIRANLVNTFTIFGSAFTDGYDSMWGNSDQDDGNVKQEYLIDGETYNERSLNVLILSKRSGNVMEKIYYYPDNIDDSNIDNSDPTKDMKILDQSEYSVYKKNGDFVFIISCNRNKIITDEFGNKIKSETADGVFTKFRGFVTFEIPSENVSLKENSDENELNMLRYKFKFPQYTMVGREFNKNDDEFTVAWRKQHYIFEAGKFYSVSRFHGTVFNNSPDFTIPPEAKIYEKTESNGRFSNTDKINNLSYDNNEDDFGSIFYNTGVILNTGFNYKDDLPSNRGIFVFGANWLNFSIYFPQIGFFSKNHGSVRSWRSNTNFTSDNVDSDFYYTDNTQQIAAGDYNTKWFARSDLHWTDFIEVPKIDINNLFEYNNKGFNNINVESVGITLEGVNNKTYHNGMWPEQTFISGSDLSCPTVDFHKSGSGHGGRINGEPDNNKDDKFYFYKGFGDSNCFEFIKSLGII